MRLLGGSVLMPQQRFSKKPTAVKSRQKLFSSRITFDSLRAMLNYYPVIDLDSNIIPRRSSDARNTLRQFSEPLSRQASWNIKTHTKTIQTDIGYDLLRSDLQYTFIAWRSRIAKSWKFAIIRLCSSELLHLAGGYFIYGHLINSSIKFPMNLNETKISRFHCSLRLWRQLQHKHCIK